MKINKVGYGTYFIFLIIFQLSYNESLSQTKTKKKENYFIALSPLSLVDYKDGSSIRVTIERKVTLNISLSTETGFYTSLGNFFSYKKDPNGFLLKPCIKYYLKSKRNFNNFYIGLEYQYKRQSYSLSDSILLNGSPPFDKQYSMKRVINCISVKAGNFQQIKGKFIMEWFGGLGIRFFNSKSSLSTTLYDGILRGEVHSNSTGGGYQARKIGNYILPNVTLGIKLGLKL